MSARPPLAADAALVLGIASTAMPFAPTSQAEAESWLRILRLYGEAGVVLQALGVGEDRLEMPPQAAPSKQGEPSGRGPHDRASDRDPVERVADEASRIAAKRDAAGLATTDLLLAVMHVYGDDFDRALQTHGTARAEVTERLRERMGPKPAGC